MSINQNDNYLINLHKTKTMNQLPPAYLYKFHLIIRNRTYISFNMINIAKSDSGR